MGQPVYLDLRQFVERSGLPMRTIERLITDGRLPAVMIGRRRLIAATELERLPDILSSGAVVVEKGAHG